MERKITPKEYADLRGKTLQGVTKAIRSGHCMPGVLKIDKYGRFYLLTVDIRKIKKSCK